MTKQLQHILCVDDDEDIRNIATMSMEISGEFSVTTLDNAQDMIDQIEDINPDAIVLDVMMPIMDGLSALKILRRNPAVDNIPIILMTARVQPAEVKEYLESGASGVIPKPFDPMTLPFEITKIWHEFNKK